MDTELGGVPPEEATVDLGPFDLDMLRSLASGRVRGGARGRDHSPAAWGGTLPGGGCEICLFGAPGVRITGLEFGEGYLAVGPDVEVLIACP